MKLDVRATVREFVLENPQAARVFETFGIDYCCGGDRSLEQACRQANLSPKTVVEELGRSAPGEQSAPDHWTVAPLTELADHIINKHHAFIRSELPRLTELLQKVRTRHVAAHPELNKIVELFDALSAELATHMMKEERVLFPMIKQIEASKGSAPSGSYGCSIAFPIRQMMFEHDNAGDALSGIRSLSSAFQPPPDACASFHALYEGLQEFEHDLHRHIHLENNILFPRTLKLAGEQKEVGRVAS